MIISSHVLDSVIGDHAKKIRIACFDLSNGQKIELFDVIGNDEGRIAETVDILAGAEIELVFHSADYFATQATLPNTTQMMQHIVVRVAVPEGVDRIHIPIMLSPHAYSVWWTG